MEYNSRLAFYSDNDNKPVLALSVASAVTLPQRLRGLLGFPAPPEGCALLIEHCGSVHTIGMKYPLDLIFLDKNRCVTRVVPNVPPNRPFIPGGWRAATVLEATSGWLPLARLHPGMKAVIDSSVSQ